LITDTHAHVFWNAFDADREAVFERAREAGVGRMILVGTNLETSHAAFELCAGRPGLYPTAGIHPHDAADADDAVRESIRELCEGPECVAVGETGLDFFKNYSPRGTQEDNFRWHLELARELDKPVVVHSRDAHDTVVEMLRAAGGVRGVMHCYSLGEVELPAYLELGFYISFSGMVTYPKNEANRAAARAVPEDRLLVETDCPFLAPQTQRGKRNEPALVREVLGRIAQERGVEVERLARSTSENAARLFGLPALDRT